MVCAVSQKTILQVLRKRKIWNQTWIEIAEPRFRDLPAVVLSSPSIKQNSPLKASEGTNEHKRNVQDGLGNGHRTLRRSGEKRAAEPTLPIYKRLTTVLLMTDVIEFMMYRCERRDRYYSQKETRMKAKSLKLRFEVWRLRFLGVSEVR